MILRVKLITRNDQNLRYVFANSRLKPKLLKSLIMGVQYVGSKHAKKQIPKISCNRTLKGTVSRDNLYSIFFITHILLVLLEVLYEDFKF
jgi:hypothetical protein